VKLSAGRIDSARGRVRRDGSVVSSLARMEFERVVEERSSIKGPAL
jgi:hypothetical protein